MAIGALIGAYLEDESGGLRALLPLAGETLIDYQARCLSAAGASPIVAYVEKIPPVLQQAFERLRSEGIAIVAVSDAAEAASRFEAGSELLLLADGVVPDVADLSGLVAADEAAILTVPDDEEHADFERIDAQRRWGGVARLDAGLVGATAAMLGDWDLQSTLLRRAIQAGVPVVASSEGEGRGPFLAQEKGAMQAFERRLLLASRGQREDAVARYLLPIVEEAATERLMESRVRPNWLLWSALLLMVAAAFCFTRGWGGGRGGAVVVVDAARPRRGPAVDVAPQAAFTQRSRDKDVVARIGARAPRPGLVRIAPWRRLGRLACGTDRGRFRRSRSGRARRPGDPGRRMARVTPRGGGAGGAVRVSW